MLGVVLDLIIVIGMQAALQGVSDDWRDIIFPVIGITVGNLAIALGLGSTLGLFVLVPMALLTFALLFLLCKMTIRNAAITTAVILAAKVALSFIFAR
jgi:hypothetical protein